MSDSGTWSKHLTLHCSICIVSLIINIAKLYEFLWSTEVCMLATPTVQRNYLLALRFSSNTFQLTTLLCIK